MEREHGRIVSVSTETLGSTLTADVAAGATVLPVFDAAAFDPNGDSLSLNGAVLTYATSDDDASTVTLSDPLPAAASEGDRVDCWSTLYQAPVTEKTAMVQVDGDDDNPDPIEAWVPHFLADRLSDGDRGGPGESVVVGYDEEEDSWEILDVLGHSDQAGVKFWNTDTFTVTAIGGQTIELSRTPKPGSLHVEWEGLQQPPSEWVLNGSTLTIPDPNSLVAIGDTIDLQYAYDAGPILPGFVADGSTWSYLQVTDGADYSSASYDDSGWPTGEAPFGTGDGHGSGWPSDLPDWVTPWDSNDLLWIRRRLSASGSGYTVNIKIDNEVWVYWNGTQIGHASDGRYATFGVDLPAGAAGVLAAEAYNTPGGPGYLDVEVTPK